VRASKRAASMVAAFPASAVRKVHHDRVADGECQAKRAPRLFPFDPALIWDPPPIITSEDPAGPFGLCAEPDLAFTVADQSAQSGAIHL
jgi:hypothetical protein